MRCAGLVWPWTTRLTPRPIRSGRPTAASYVGSGRCVECHKTAGETWAKSGPRPGLCHPFRTQGGCQPQVHRLSHHRLWRPFGLPAQFGRDKLVNVGCESCHGPGSLHVQQREGDKTISFSYRPLDAGDCKKCHTANSAARFTGTNSGRRSSTGRSHRSLEGRLDGVGGTGLGARPESAVAALLCRRTPKDHIVHRHGPTRNTRRIWLLFPADPGRFAHP